MLPTSTQTTNKGHYTCGLVSGEEVWGNWGKGILWHLEHQGYNRTAHSERWMTHQMDSCSWTQRWIRKHKPSLRTPGDLRRMLESNDMGWTQNSLESLYWKERKEGKKGGGQREGKEGVLEWGRSSKSTSPKLGFYLSLEISRES